MTSQNLSETKTCLTDIWKEKKQLRRTAEQLALYLIDHNTDKNISNETKKQVQGFINACQLSYESIELLETILKIHLKDLEVKKKK